MSTELDFDSFNVNGFSYSTLPLDTLEASEMTLVNLLVDESGSVGGFQNEMEACMRDVLDSCKKHPRSQNLMFRVATFDSGANRPTVRELHGFTPVDSVDTSKYKLSPCGMTPLYDAMLDSVSTTVDYAKSLYQNDIFTNIIVICITDGEENSSVHGTPNKIKKAIADVTLTECAESIQTILISIGPNNLQSVKDACGFDELVELADASAGRIAKLAQWISQSISSASQALGTGGPSQTIVATF